MREAYTGYEIRRNMIFREKVSSTTKSMNVVGITALVIWGAILINLI
jgi:hypothetical protein